MKRKVFFITVLVQAGVVAIACFFQFLFLLVPLLSIGFLVAGIVHRTQPNDEDKSGQQKGDGMILGGLFWILAELVFIVVLVNYGPNC